MAITQQQFADAVNRFAAVTTGGTPGFVPHRPEDWASHTNCFQNVREKVRLAGGSGEVGWMFLHRMSPRFGDYVVATHHAIWCSPGNELADVTALHPEIKHQPFRTATGILFLGDPKAQPRLIEHEIAPLPSRFFPIGKDPSLAEYVKGLQRRESADCQAFHDGVAAWYSLSSPDNCKN
jgi:hypothetical protein